MVVFQDGETDLGVGHVMLIVMIVVVMMLVVLSVFVPVRMMLMMRHISMVVLLIVSVVVLMMLLIVSVVVMMMYLLLLRVIIKLDQRIYISREVIFVERIGQSRRLEIFSDFDVIVFLKLLKLGRGLLDVLLEKVELKHWPQTILDDGLSVLVQHLGFHVCQLLLLVGIHPGPA